MKGPYAAGANNLKVFITKGLEQQLLADGIKAIVDFGYHGHQRSISAPNPHDSAGVRLFKSPALNWHETLNTNELLKNLDCLSDQFRHSVAHFENCFVAVCVICQYKIEIATPLFDIIVEGVFDCRDYHSILFYIFIKISLIIRPVIQIFCIYIGLSLQVSHFIFHQGVTTAAYHVIEHGPSLLNGHLALLIVCCVNGSHGSRK
jgi:hypothetical protein